MGILRKQGVHYQMSSIKYGRNLVNEYQRYLTITNTKRSIYRYHAIARSLSEFLFWCLDTSFRRRIGIQRFTVSHQRLFSLNGSAGHCIRLLFGFTVPFPFDLDICWRFVDNIDQVNLMCFIAPVSDGCKASWSCCMTFFSRRSSSDANRAVPLPARAMPSTRWWLALLPKPAFKENVSSNLFKLLTFVAEMKT